jgi:hypothetical protein
MPYYNEYKESVNTDRNGPVWFTPVELPELPHQENVVLVFDEFSLSWVTQSKLPKDWTEYLISIGIKKIEPTQKVDNEGSIISKTKEELYQEDLISKTEYIRYISPQVSTYAEQKALEGGNYDSHRFRCDEISANRISNAIMQAQLFPEDMTPAWVSEYKVDSQGVKIEGTDNAYYPIDSIDKLKNLGQFIGRFWRTCFYKRRTILDILPNKTKEELLVFDLDFEWNKI